MTSFEDGSELDLYGWGKNICQNETKIIDSKEASI